MEQTIDIKRGGLLNWVVYATLGLLVLSILYIRGSFFLTADMRDIVSNVPDDACYFFKIAWNVVSGKGLSFDGINLTNGFQPLWLYVLLPLASVMREATPEEYFRAALFYQMIFLLIAGIILFQAVSRVASKPLALASVAVFYFFTRYIFSKGMETGVLMLTVAVLLAFALRYRVFAESNPRVSFVLGVLLGLVILARLDMIFLVLIIYATVGGMALVRWRDNGRALLQDLLLSILGTALVATPYFVYNKIVFGDFMPISGKLKNTFPYIVQPDFGTPRFKIRDIVAAAVAMAYIGWSAFTIRIWRNYPDVQKYFFTAVLLGALAVFAHYLNTALFMKWAVFTWHFAFYYFMLCVIPVAFVLQLKWLTTRESVYTVGALGVTLIIVGHILTNSGEQFLRKSRWHVAAYEAAVWARQNTDVNEVFARKDAGIFGLFSERRVINLDGLVNNMEYQETLKDGKLNDYFRRKGVDYLVFGAIEAGPYQNQPVFSGDYEFSHITYYSFRYNTVSDPIRVYRSDEVYRSEPYLDGDYRTVFLIWRLRHNQNSEGER